LIYTNHPDANSTVLRGPSLLQNSPVLTEATTDVNSHYLICRETATPCVRIYRGGHGQYWHRQLSHLV